MGLDVWRPKREDIMKPFLVFLMAIMTSEAMSLGGNKDESEQNTEAGEDDSADWMQYLNANRFDPSDPKSLFGAVYGKRFDPSDPKSLFSSVYSNYRSKRFDPSDPRSLFSALYSNYRSKRQPDPRSLFSAVYGNYNGGYKKRYDPVGDLYSSYKRAYKPNDPRSLFRAVYGYRK